MCVRVYVCVGVCVISGDMKREVWNESGMDAHVHVHVLHISYIEYV